MKSLIALVLIALIRTENPTVLQLSKDNDFKLSGYIIRDTYILSSSEKIVIASQVPQENGDVSGLRLLLVRENKIAFRSRDVGESYIYRPTFYRFADNSMLIVCEMGFEYSTGVDVFEYRHGRITKFGNIDVATDKDDVPVSVVPNMKIEKKFHDRYDFIFTGKLFVHPGGNHETKIEGALVKGVYLKDTGKISLMVKGK